MLSPGENPGFDNSSADRIFSGLPNNWYWSMPEACAGFFSPKSNRSYTFTPLFPPCRWEDILQAEGDFRVILGAPNSSMNGGECSTV